VEDEWSGLGGPQHSARHDWRVGPVRVGGLRKQGGAVAETEQYAFVYRKHKLDRRWWRARADAGLNYWAKRFCELGRCRVVRRKKEMDRTSGDLGQEGILGLE
jgi:hypothetical protein